MGTIVPNARYWKTWVRSNRIFQMLPVKLLRLIAVIAALVVPLQGIAAVAAGICMSMGHHQSAAADGGHGEQGHDGHDHATHSHSDTGEASAADFGEGKPHCGPCMACCASASIAGPVAFPISASTFHPQYLFSQYPPLGVEPHGLYRPPLAL